MATGEGIIVSAIASSLSRSNWKHICGSVMSVVCYIRGLGSQNLIIQCPLIIIHILCIIRIKVIQLLRQLQHIVSRTGLTVAVANDIICLLIWFCKFLTSTYTADGISITGNCHLPEVGGYIIIIAFRFSGFCSCFIQFQRTDNLRDMLVCMTSCNIIIVICQVIKEGRIIKQFCTFNKFFVTCVKIQFCQRFIKSTKLTGNIHIPHFGQLFLRQYAQTVDCPFTKCCCRFQTLFTSGIGISIQKSCN